MPLDREGSYLARIVDTKVCEGKTGSCSLYAKFAILAYYDGAEWTDWTPSEIETEGDFYFRLKNGDVSERNVRDVCSATGWSGSPIDWDNGNIPERTVLIIVKSEVYEGKTRFRPSFIRRADANPIMGREGVSAERLAALQSEVGSAIRSFVPAVPFKAPAVPNFQAPSSDPMPQ